MGPLRLKKDPSDYNACNEMPFQRLCIPSRNRGKTRPLKAQRNYYHFEVKHNLKEFSLIFSSEGKSSDTGEHAKPLEALLRSGNFVSLSHSDLENL
jgi:hypothetical protein